MAGVSRTGSNIQIDNVKETVRALKEFEPEIQRRLNRQIRKALQPTLAGAQARYPKGQWQINITQKKLLGSIAAASGGGAVGRNWDESAPGIRAAIFEFAGSIQPGKTPQAQGLIRSLTERYGSPGRFLWDAWDAEGKQALEQIRESVQQAERELQARLSASGEDF